MTIFGDSAGTWNSEYGEFISDDHQRFAEVLKDVNPNLELAFIPRKDRDESDTKPFAIVEHRPGFEPQIIRYLSVLEMERPSEILAWCAAGDLVRNRPQDVLARIEREETMQELLDLKRKEDELEDILDMGAFVGRTPLNKFKIQPKGRFIRT
ncbi:MAG TPA: hypothetical protein VN039_00140 [Nitrospira sp.]|nr:hypothetical protein [Nitrospira sp.]